MGWVAQRQFAGAGRRVKTASWFALEVLEERAVLDARFVIAEFMASNQNGLRDEDRDRSDWIEVANIGDAAGDLAGWYLTDDPDDLAKWRFPATPVGVDERVVVFASDKMRYQSSQPLHTNFRLNIDGDFLALVRPDGVTIEQQFSPRYAPQESDVSYGMVQPSRVAELLGPGHPLRAFVPLADNAGPAQSSTWFAPDFDDSTWLTGNLGIGYERSTGFGDFIAADVNEAMYGLNTTLWIRAEFDVADLDSLYSLDLSMQYDDGFVAYLNGVEIARRNAPDQISWDSIATRQNSDGAAVRYEPIATPGARALLVPGRNVLAIHALNDNVRSSDFLMSPRLVAGFAETIQTQNFQYFTSPTPGLPNGVGTTLSITNVTHSPTRPAPDEPLQVVAHAHDTRQLPPTLTLHYRAMFDDEQTTTMFDDGQHGDGAASDGTYGAVIPPLGLAAGQMLRYRISGGADPAAPDVPAATAPRFVDPLDTEQYYGTVIAAPALDTSLPVMELFIEDILQTDTREGARGALFYNGEFYDNIRMDVHGFTTLGYPKKSHDVFFPRDHRFLLNDAAPRYTDINLLTNYGDRTKMRNAMSYELYRETGTPAHLAFPLRVQNNGQFWAIADFVEDGDDEYLERAGLDRRGALYKMDNEFLSATVAVEKKTRTYEDASDLNALVRAMNLPEADRAVYLHDHVDIAATVNYLVGLVISGESDCCGRNYYMFRDTEGTGRWRILPWDVDKSLGRQGTFDEELHITPGGIFAGSNNRLIASLLAIPTVREMYLRRLQTVFDQFLQSEETPVEERWFESRIAHFESLLARDEPLDTEAWGLWGAKPTWAEQISLLRDTYLPARRDLLTANLRTANRGPLPEQRDDVPVQIAEVDASPVSGNQQEEFIRLHNPLEFAVDLSGWRIEGDIAFELIPGTVIPAGGDLYLVSDSRAFLQRSSGPGGGQSLLVQGNYQGTLSNWGAQVRLVSNHGTLIARHEAPAAPTSVQQNLRITELMFHPRSLPTDTIDDEERYEFIELANLSTAEPISLDGVQLAGGVEFHFSNDLLQPGERAVLVHDREAFVARYGSDVRILGEYGTWPYRDRLSNRTDAMRLLDRFGELIAEVEYSDAWYPDADGLGASLGLRQPAFASPQANGADDWYASLRLDGSPGFDDRDLSEDGVISGADVDLLYAMVAAGDGSSDLNRDGNRDQNDVAFYLQQHLGSQFGDANLDGRFDSADLVQIFQRARYNAPHPDGAGWADGDWNGDGQFDSSDIVLAFTIGNFLE